MSYLDMLARISAAHVKARREIVRLKRKLGEAELSRDRALEGWSRAAIDRDELRDQTLALELDADRARDDRDEWQLRARTAWAKLHALGIETAEVPDDGQ